MPTIPQDRLHELQAGDHICAIDGYQKDLDVAGIRSDGAILLVNCLNTGTEWALYPDQVQASLTYRRPGGAQYTEPIGPALPTVPDRTLRAIRRNGWHAKIRELAALTDEDPRGVHVDRFEGMAFGQMGSYGYALTERGPGRRWRISLTGRLALAALDRSPSPSLGRSGPTATRGRPAGPSASTGSTTSTPTAPS